MDPKLLTEGGWKVVVQKFKVKDNGLQRALSVYEKLPDEKYADRLKALALVGQLAGTLKKAKEILALAEVVKYLGNVVVAAESEKDEITKAKVSAEKVVTASAKAAMDTRKKEQDDGDEDEDEEEEEEEGDYADKLKKAINNLKAAKVPYNFIVCDAKPQCGVVVSKQLIGAKHKEELTKVTGGSKRFLKPGKCRRDGTTLIFEMDNPPQGLAGKLLKAIKFFTGIKYKVMVGNESADDDDEQPAAADAGAASQPAASGPAKPALEKAPEVWRQTQRVAKASIDQLRAAVRKAFAAEAPKVVAEIEQNLKKLDSIFEKLDDKLAVLLANAYAAKDPVARSAGLKTAKALLAEHIKYVTSEPMIAHLDANPFGVKTNLKQTLTESLKQMAQAIGV